MYTAMLHADLNTTRRIGVEFEMTFPLVGAGSGHDVQRTLAAALNANGLRAIARGYSPEPLPPAVDLAVESDASVQGETRYAGITWHSVEVKTRILNGINDWEVVVPSMLEIARYLGARVNASTGHHVHLSLPEVGAKPKVIRSLTSLVTRVEPVIYGLLAPSRSRSTYCVPLGGKVPDLRPCKSLPDFLDRLSGQSRYYGLNLNHLADTSPRVEYRYHQGTLDPIKARHWLRFLLQLTEHAVTRNCQSMQQPLSNDRQGFERMAITIGLRVNSKIYSKVSRSLSQTGRYMLQRWRHFNEQDDRAPKATSAEDPAEREVA